MNMKTIEELGLNYEMSKKTFDTIDELKQYNTPSFVIAKAVTSFHYSTDRRNTVRIFKKDTQKVMSAFMYERLEKNPVGQPCLIPGDEKFKDVYKHYQGENLDGKSLLIWRTGGIGDLLFIQPNLIYLKKKYPTCKIVFGCDPSYFQLINNWSCIDQIIDLPIKYEILKSCDYHVTFEGVIERCKEAEHTNAYRLFTDWMNLNLPDEMLVPKQFTKSKNNKLVDEYLKKEGLENTGFVYAQIRTSSPIRTPSGYVWKSILEPLAYEGFDIVISDTPKLEKAINHFIDKVIEPDYQHKFHIACSISKSIDIGISLASRSNMIICPDSSFVHIGAALNKPTFAIYGPFPGDIRVSTYKKCDFIEPEPSTICEYGGVHCCIHGHEPCPAHFNGISPCMDELDFEKAHLKIKNLMEQ